MTATVHQPVITPLARELEEAHAQGVGAAVAGMQDPALRQLRLAGPGVPALAEAAVSSATPFLRAPLLSRIYSAARLHPAGGHEGGRCHTCSVPAPCPTSRGLQP